MVQKKFITADRLLEDSFALGDAVLASGFRPTHIAAIWRGGAPVGIAVHELFDYRGHACDHIAVRTASYSGIDEQDANVRVAGLGYLVGELRNEDALLIVDDVFDTGRSVEALLRELERQCEGDMPETVRIATVYYKPSRNRTDREPDYHVHQTDDWLVFPHELDGLSDDEIRMHKPGAAMILGR